MMQRFLKKIRKVRRSPRVVAESKVVDHAPCTDEETPGFVETKSVDDSTTEKEVVQDDPYATLSIEDLVSKHSREAKLKFEQEKKNRIEKKRARHRLQETQVFSGVVSMITNKTPQVKKLIVESFVEHVGCFKIKIPIQPYNNNKLAHNVNLLLAKERGKLTDLLDAKGGHIVIKIRDCNGDSIYDRDPMYYASVIVFLVYDKLLVPKLAGDQRNPFNHSLHFYCNCKSSNALKESSSSSSSLSDSSSSYDDGDESFDCGFTSCGRQCPNCECK